MEAGLGDDVDLDGRVAARVVDGPSVDLADGHDATGPKTSPSHGEVFVSKILCQM